MTPNPQRSEPLPRAADEADPLDLTSDQIALEPTFDQGQWAESRAEERGAGGRQVLGWTLSLLAALWLAYTAWQAGRTLVGQPLTSPQIAQWLSIAAGPLALMGLVWLMFGRTRRKEAERFTRSVIAMRTETQSLEALMEVLSQRIRDSGWELTTISQHLMKLGDEATFKLGGITREFDSSTEKLRRHGEALDHAAEAARTDIGVLLDDLPRAEQTARQLAEQLRAAGNESTQKAASFGQQVDELAGKTREADQIVAEATARLTARLAEIESAGAAASGGVREAESGLSGALDALLERTSATLSEIRTGIDVQSSVVAALVEQA